MLTDVRDQPPGARYIHEITFASTTGPNYRGTLCCANGEYEHGEKRISKKKWASAWFAIEIDQSDDKAPAEIDSLLDRIHSALQYRHHWIVLVHPTPATTLILVSWHSGIIGKARTISEDLEQGRRRRVQALIAEKMTDPYKLVTSVHAYDPVVDNLPDETRLRKKYSNILEWLSQDVYESEKPQREDPLVLAFHNGVVEIGEKLYFNRRRFLPKTSLLGISQPVATIIREDEQILLSFKGKSFTIEDLTRVILRELGHTAWVPRASQAELFWSFDKGGFEPFLTEFQRVYMDGIPIGTLNRYHQPKIDDSPQS